MRQARRAPWLGIELRHLAALSGLASEGSFRAAADRLGYVQSTISQQLQHLEQLVGSRLVERRRGSSPVVLTETGELLLHHFDEILGRFAAAQADVDALREGTVGRLRVGVCGSLATHLMPRILAPFADRLPGVHVEMHGERLVGDLAERVEAGELDLAIGERPMERGPFEATELMRDPFLLLVPATWPIALRGEAPSLVELADLPLIGHGRSRFAKRVDAELRAQGVEPRYSFCSDVDEAVRALVAAGIGAAIVPQLTSSGADERTVALELGEILVPRAIAVYWHRERQPTPARAAFVEVASHVCREDRTHVH